MSTFFHYFFGVVLILLTSCVCWLSNLWFTTYKDKKLLSDLKRDNSRAYVKQINVPFKTDTAETIAS
jgi:hypothetical protein